MNTKITPQCADANAQCSRYCNRRRHLILTDDAGSALHPQSDCGIGHRVLASRSVLALVIDEECVFAGLQGGDIVVSRLQLLLSRGFSNLIPSWSYFLEVSSKLFIF